MLKESPAVVTNSVRFNMEADSLNCSILGPDAAPGTEEFDLFVREVVREMTVKAGQKCTAIRRTIVPAGTEEAVIKAISKRLEGITIGDPAVEGVRMGPLASRAQVRDVGASAAKLRGAAELVFGGRDFSVTGADREKGAFFAPMLLSCAKPFSFNEPHDVEAFGPVNTVMPYGTIDDAIELAKLGRGSLVGRCSRPTRPWRGGWCWVSRRTTAGSWSSIAPARRRARATGHPCRTSCTAGRVGPAAVRSSAEFAASCTTCSAPRSKARPPC
jgi:oxepin-CoA hydrolase/3-oxo-5,6-dehydrosuberyl-CoA semialdehyde dehydrogenase